MYRGNLIANAFNTDWALEYGDSFNGYLLRGTPRSFANGSCNCVLSGDCQQPARVGPPHLVLPGLVVGCSPMDALRLSTLECLFSTVCINTILSHLDYYTTTDGSEPNNFTSPANLSFLLAPLLQSKLGRFSPTTPIGSLLDESFIDQSTHAISFENYFSVCAPSSCYYEYVKSNDSLFIFTSLLGVYGGLTVSLRFIIWNSTRICYAIKRWYRTRTTLIEPFLTEGARY